MEIGIGAGDFHRLVPDERMRAEQRRPVELDENRIAALVDEPERMHAEALHHAIAARDRAIGHDPQQRVRRFRHQRDEIPERVVRRGRLRHRMVRLGFHGVHEIRELHRVLDEEDRHVVADQIPVAVLGVELHGEAAHVARRILRAAFARDRRKAHEDRRALALLAKRRGDGQIRQ